MANQQLSTNTFGCAKWIVSSDATQGTHTTIAAAISSSSSGDTIFIRPGTYTENLTLKAGVSLTSYGSDSSLNGTGVIIISGTCTMTTAGSVTISGIQLQTNSAALLAVTGSADSIVNLNNCYLNCSNNTGVTFSSSSAASAINIFKCNGNLGTTGIALHTMSSLGTLTYFGCSFSNTGLSTTASSNSAGIVTMQYSYFKCVFSTSSTGILLGSYYIIDAILLNTTGITLAGSGSSSAIHITINSGTASSVSVGTGTTLGLYQSDLFSNNTNNITGAGTINFGSLSLHGTFINNVTTQAGGAIVGIRAGNPPSAAFIGEVINNFVAFASAVSITTGSTVNITSVTLTPGVWNLSSLVGFAGGAITGTSFRSSISSASATIDANFGLYTTGNSLAPTALQNQHQAIPPVRINLSSSTTYYLTAYAVYTVGSVTAYGSINAYRVG